MADMLDFGGAERFDQPPAAVYAALADLEQVKALLPEVESSERVNERTLRCVVRPGFSFLRGKMTATIVLTAADAPGEGGDGGTLDYQVTSKGIGAQVDVEASVRLEGDGAGTRLTWQARVAKLSGLVAAVSRPLIQAAAGQVIAGAWARLRQRLSDEPAGP